MGRLVVCAGNGAVQNSTNLYGFIVARSLFLTLRKIKPSFWSLDVLSAVTIVLECNKITKTSFNMSFLSEFGPQMCLSLVSLVSVCVFPLSVVSLKLLTKDTLKDVFDTLIHLSTIVTPLDTFKEQNDDLLFTYFFLTSNIVLTCS